MMQQLEIPKKEMRFRAVLEIAHQSIAANWGGGGRRLFHFIALTRQVSAVGESKKAIGVVTALGAN